MRRQRQYQVVDRPAHTYIIVRSDLGEQDWVLVPLRRPAICAMTGAQLATKTLAWRPVDAQGTAPNRRDRVAAVVFGEPAICRQCGNRALTVGCLTCGWVPTS